MSQEELIKTLVENVIKQKFDQARNELSISLNSTMSTKMDQINANFQEIQNLLNRYQGGGGGSGQYSAGGQGQGGNQNYNNDNPWYGA